MAVSRRYNETNSAKWRRYAPYQYAVPLYPNAAHRVIVNKPLVTALCLIPRPRDAQISATPIDGQNASNLILGKKQRLFEIAAIAK